MDTTTLARIDSFPYRHRVAELMTSPAVSLAGAASLRQAAAVMSERHISSILVLDERGRASGIVTERDVLRQVAQAPSRLERTLREVMSSPVQGIAAEALVYRAVARMARLGLRHLPVLDADSRPLGMLTASGLLRQRASVALTLGDEIEVAADAAALCAAHDRLPAVAAALRREDVPATQVSGVVSAILCDLTARAGEIALAELRDEGRGDPPVPWCLLVLGSAGRGESLMTADQDNALVFDGDERHDAWFAGFGARVNGLLDAAGVALCPGGVMAGNAAFRKPLDAWNATIRDWVRRPRPEALMNVDIFFDFVPVLGDRSLARRLRREATRAAAASPLFLRLLADAMASAGSPFDLLGRLKLRDGRIDLKRHGLFPVVAAARTIALAWGCEATGTDDRLAAAATAGALTADVASDLAAARGRVVEAILDQQLLDIGEGRAPSSRVVPGRRGRSDRRALGDALRALSAAGDAVRGALTARPPERAP